MRTCPACNKNLSERYTYCIECGLNFIALEKLDFIIKQTQTLRDGGIISEAQRKNISQIYEFRKSDLIKEHLPQQSIANTKAEKVSALQPKADYLQRTSFQISAFLENFSINWLLYLGAFLVSVASIIFIAYKWQEFSPYFKLLILLGFSGTLYGFGQYTLKGLKLRKAGLTLIGLGLFMLPIIFYGTNANLKAVAWSYFWLVNSVFTMTVFAFGAIYYNSKLFAWVSVFPVLIATWSVSRILGTPLEGSAFYYVFSGVGLLLLSSHINDRYKQLYQGLLVSLAYTVTVLTLVAGSYTLNPLFYGRYEFLSNQFLLYLFGTIFFALSSIKEKQISPFITIILLYLSASHAAAVYHFKFVHHLYLVILLSVLLISLTFVNKIVSYYKSALIGVTLCVGSITSLLLGIFWLANYIKMIGFDTYSPVNALQNMVLMLAAVLYWLLCSINLNKRAFYPFYILLALSFSIIPMIFHLHVSIVAYIITGFSVIYLILSTYYKKSENVIVLLDSSLLLAVIGGFCSFADNPGATIVWIIASIVFGLASYISKNKHLVFGTLIGSFIAYSFALSVLKVDFDIHNIGLMYMPYWGLILLAGLWSYYLKNKYLSSLLFTTSALLSVVFMQLALSISAPHSVIWKLSLFYGLFAVSMAVLYESAFFAAVGYLLLTGAIGYGFSAFGAKKIVIAYAVLASSLVWYCTTFVRLFFKPFEKIRWGILSVAIFAAFISPLFFPLGKQFTILLASAGLLYALYFVLERKEMFVHLSIVFLIGSINFYTYFWHHVQIQELYISPWALYLMILGLIYLRLADKPEFENLPSRLELAQLALWTGAVLMFAPPVLLSVGESFPHAWIIFISAPVIVVLGIQNRVKSFVFCAGTTIVLEGIIQIGEPLLSLPRWVSLGGLGMGLISSAVLFERNRNKVVELTKNTVQLIKEWS